MKTIKLLFIFVYLILMQSIFAQNKGIFIPKEFQNALAKGTRSVDGKPGPNYFQNGSDYKIYANFDPKTAVLEGSETIKYHNNSPDSLKFLVVRLYQNILKPNAIRGVEVDPSDFISGVNIKKMLVNGTEIQIQNITEYGTNLIVRLKQKIAPKSVSTIEIDWNVNLPNKTLIRMGRYDTTSYFVAYWYPQIAVYDDISGWNIENYNGIAEFYNDYSNFDVTINVPKNFVVWATGELQNTEDIFSDIIQKRIFEAKNNDNLVRIITVDDYKNNSIFKQNYSTKWHFVAKNVTDFAFGTSDHYIWDGTSVIVDKDTKRRSMANAVYKVDSKTGEDIAMEIRQTMLMLSTNVIGYPYPYPHNTVWEGHFGMEFPMMCNNGPQEELLSEVFVTSHEVSHSYFPFLVGTNETYNAWIDEGLITFIPKEIEFEYGNKNPHYYLNAYSKRTMGYSIDLPMTVPTTQMTENTYMMQNYGRAAVGFYLLSETMGSKNFKNFILEFINRWQGKHPSATDFYYTLCSVTGQDWAWFWTPWFYEFGYADLALENVSIKGNQVAFDVKKMGNNPVPIKLTIFFDDSTTEVITQSTMVWKNSNVFSFKQKFSKPVVKIVLGDDNIPDAFTNNNIYQKKM